MDSILPHISTFFNTAATKSRLLLLTAFFSIIGLSACGGSESESTATTAARIDSSNAITIVKAVAPLAMGFDQSVELTESIVPREAESQDPLTIATNAALNRLGGSPLRRLTLSDTTQCEYSGSVTISTDNSDPDTLTSGDSVTLNYVECANSPDKLINGKMIIFINNFTETSDSSAILLEVRIQFSDLTVVSSTDSSTMDGDTSVVLDLLTDITAINIYGESFTMSSMGNTQSISNFSNTYSEDSSQSPAALTLAGNGTVGSSQFTGTVSYQTPVTFAAWGDNYPYTGELLISGADNTSLRLITLSDVDIRIDADYNGDGDVDQSFYMTWAELEE